MRKSVFSPWKSLSKERKRLFAEGETSLSLLKRRHPGLLAGAPPVREGAATPTPAAES